MQRNTLRTLSILGTVVGILVLHGYSMQVEPKRVDISDVGEHEGRYVIVTGRIAEMNKGTWGINIVLIQSNASVTIFLDKTIESVQIGDLAQVMGMVSSFGDGYAITISGNSFFRILRHWDSNILTLPGLAQDPWDHRGMNVNVSCRIRTPLTEKEDYSYVIVEDNEFPDYSLMIYIYGLNIQRLYNGASIFINCRFDYNQERMSFFGVMDSPEHHLWDNTTS